MRGLRQKIFSREKKSMKQSFDTHQFADRVEYPVNARPTTEGWISTGIDYADYSRMSTQQHKQSGERRLPTPDWAVNDVKLQYLLAAFLEERAGFRKEQPGTIKERIERAKKAIANQRPRQIATLDKLCHEYTLLKKFGAHPEMSDDEVNNSLPQPLVIPSLARAFIEKKRLRDLEIEIEGIDSYLIYTEADGGLSKLGSIVYLYYRTMLDSVGVGTELGLKPPHVRQVLFRLHHTARRLWPEEKSSSQFGGMFDDLEEFSASQGTIGSMADA